MVNDKEIVKDLEGKFYGSHKILQAWTDGEKTPRGDLIVKLELEGAKGRPEEVPWKLTSDVITSEATDLTTLRDNRCRKAVSEIIGVLLENNIRVSEIDYVNAVTKGSMEESFKHVLEIVFKTDEKTVLDLDRMLKNEGSAEMLADAEKRASGDN